MDITLYLVGSNVDEAFETFPFDSFESAKSFSLDNPGTSIFSVSAIIVPHSIELVERG